MATAVYVHEGGATEVKFKKGRQPPAKKVSVAFPFEGGVQIIKVKTPVSGKLQEPTNSGKARPIAPFNSGKISILEAPETALQKLARQTERDD